jgi:hypothetical protein
MVKHMFYLFVVFSFNQDVELYLLPEVIYILTILNDENKQQKVSNVFQKIF